MEKGIVITGKDFPESLSLVKAALSRKYAVMVSLPEGETAKIPAEPVKSFTWQKSSSVSARSFVFNAQTSLPQLTHAILIFDTPLYIKKTHIKDSQALSSGIDSLIAAYMHITQEIIGRFLKLGGGTMCFVFKPFGARKDGVSPSGAFVLAAASAFKTFAEQTAVSFGSSGISFVLCEENPLLGRDDENAESLFSALEAAASVKDAAKRNSVRWIRSGSKFPVGLGIFSR